MILIILNPSKLCTLCYPSLETCDCTGLHSTWDVISLRWNWQYQVIYLVESLSTRDTLLAYTASLSAWHRHWFPLAFYWFVGEEHSYTSLVATYSWSQGAGFVVCDHKCWVICFIIEYLITLSESHGNTTFQWMRQALMIILAKAINRVNIWNTP